MRRSTARRLAAAFAASVAAALVAGALVAPAQAASRPAKPDPATKLAEQLVKKVTAQGANRHLVAFQRIAEQNGGTRASGTSGYDASVDYAVRKLRQAGYQVRTPSFTYESDVTDAQTLVVGAASHQVIRMSYSTNTPAGGLSATLLAVPVDDTPGCQVSDYAGLSAAGTIAVVRRGACSFAQKAEVAGQAGAAAIIVYNNTAGDLNGTLGSVTGVPAGGVTQEVGAALVSAAGQNATLNLQGRQVATTTRNVIAQTRTGNAKNVVLAGAHLDSVPEGPGINDNGSGAASLLEVALELGGSPKVNNAVRFAWWGAEEAGLLGAEDYVSKLTFEQQLDIALYFNFDMIASPNAGYFVYDGDDSDGVGAGPGPYGSAQLEKTIVDFFANRLRVPTEGTDFDGRSDYGPFIEVGIPSGGTFTGAEEVKTAPQAAKWGGTAGIAFDPCYHQACDNLGNVDRVALDRNLDAIAWGVGIYAHSTQDINGVGRAKIAQMRSQLKGLSRMMTPGIIAPGKKAA